MSVKRKDKPEMKKGAVTTDPLTNGKKEPFLDKEYKDIESKYRTMFASEDNDTQYVGAWIAKCPEEIPIVAHMLSDENPKVRENAAYALGTAAEEGGDITCAFSDLAKAISDRFQMVRTCAAMALAKAANADLDVTTVLMDILASKARQETMDELFAEHIRSIVAYAVINERIREKSISILINGLSSGDPAVRLNSADFLGKLSGRWIANPESAISPLSDALSDEDFNVAEACVKALGKIARAQTTSEETRSSILVKLIEFLHSERFCCEMEKNSSYYEKMAKAISGIMASLKITEERGMKP